MQATKQCDDRPDTLALDYIPPIIDHVHFKVCETHTKHARTSLTCVDLLTQILYLQL